MKYKALSSIFYSNNSQYLQIYNDRYNSESTYRFNFKINEYESFVVINHDILQRVESIIELDRELLKKMNSVPQIALIQYRKKCLIDEIKMTNEIEGIISTRKEINDILSDKTNMNEDRRLYGLVKKYELLTEEDMNFSTCEDIRNLYDELVLKEVIEENAEHAPDGNIFRNDTVYVKDRGSRVIHTGIYPEREIIKSMTSGLSVLNNNEYNFLIRIAVFHYMFGYIHPFYDGNGRVSRFISSYLLSRKLQYLVSYKLSNTIKENLNSYYKSFKEANDKKNRGDLTVFVIKFFDVLIKALNDLCESLEERRNRLDYFGEIANKVSGDDDKKKNILFILVQNTLFGETGLSIDELYTISDVGKSKIRNSIKELEGKGFLSIVKDGKRNLYDVDLNAMSELELV